MQYLQLRDGICARSRPHDQAGETSEQRRARECRAPLAAAASVERTNVAPVQLGRRCECCYSRRRQGHAR